MDKKYWPFELPADRIWPPEEICKIAFLRVCHQQGLRAYAFGAGNFGAENSQGRCGEIIFRGKRRWEIVLGENGTKQSSQLSSDFIEAATIIQNWLGVLVDQTLQAG